MQVPAIAETMRRVEARLAGHGRLLVRYSGTEPLLRIMLEGRDQAEIRALGRRDRRRRPRASGLKAEGCRLKCTRIMVKLSVNVNKVATVRNSRGGTLPSVVEAVRTCIDAGAPGITVHPRADERHITTADVHDIAAELAPLQGPRRIQHRGRSAAGLLELVHEVKPDQCTLVPVLPGEITSQAGWPADTPRDALAGVIGAMKAAGVRVSLFVDPEPAAIRWAHDHRRRSRRALHRAVRARLRARAGRRQRQLRRSTSPQRRSRTSWASASTPATISISRT